MEMVEMLKFMLFTRAMASKNVFGIFFDLCSFFNK